MSSSNVSSVTNHFPTVNEGFSTTLDGAILSGATTVPIAGVSGLTDGAVFVGIIEPGEAKEQVFTGLVDVTNTEINSVKWTRGTNVGHASGVTIVDYVTGTGVNMITKGLLVEHTQAGRHSMTSPKVTTGINDSNNNELFKVTATASAVNEVTVANAATGTAPSLTASGGDTNIDLKLESKGTGKIDFGTASIKNAIQSYTPTISATTGGSWINAGGWYMNLGGLRLAWGRVSMVATTTVGRATVTLPPSNFFTTVYAALPAIESEGNSPYQTASGDSIIGSPPATFAFYVNNTANGSSCTVTWFIIGV